MSEDSFFYHEMSHKTLRYNSKYAFYGSFPKKVIRKQCSKDLIYTVLYIKLDFSDTTGILMIVHMGSSLTLCVYIHIKMNQADICNLALYYLYPFVFQGMNEVSLEGDISAPGLKTDEDEFNTLDEPVKDTIVSQCHVYCNGLCGCLECGRSLVQVWFG